MPINSNYRTIILSRTIAYNSYYLWNNNRTEQLIPIYQQV